MSDKLFKLELVSMLHRSWHIFFTQDGKALYGKDKSNLSYPEGLEMTGKLPPLYVEDLRNAFLLGVWVGQGAEVEL